MVKEDGVLKTTIGVVLLKVIVNQKPLLLRQELLPSQELLPRQEQPLLLSQEPPPLLQNLLIPVVQILVVIYLLKLNQVGLQEMTKYYQVTFLLKVNTLLMKKVVKLN